MHVAFASRALVWSVGLLGVVGAGPFGCDPPAPTPVGGAAPGPASAASEPAVEAPAETPSEAAPATTPSRETLQVDLDRSRITFFVSKATAGHEAKFERFKAELVATDGKPSALSIDIDVGSLQTDQSTLTKHLLSADFFHVDEHPRATFRSRTLSPVDRPDEFATHRVAGQLQIKGVTKAIAFPAKVRMDDGTFVGEATMQIKAKDFAIDYPGMAEELVDDTVELEVTLTFPPAAEG